MKLGNGKRDCCKKKKYSKNGALYAIVKGRHQEYNGKGASKKPVRSYYCEWCGFYHLSSQPRFNVKTGKIG